MATIRELVISFGFDVDDAPLKKMETALDDLKSGFLAISAAAVGAAATIFGIAKSTANAADAIKDTSIAVGISYEMLQKLGYAATLSGASQEELADSLRQLARASVDAKDANSETSKAFRQMGVQALDAAGNLKAPDDLLLSLSDAFKKMPPGIQKSALAMQFFGRSGSRMIQFLDNGSQGLRDLGKEAVDLGIIIDDAAIASGAEFNDTLDSLIATAKGVMRIIGTGVIPIISELMIDMRGWIKANRELIKTKLQAFIQLLSKYLSQLWRVLTAVYYVFRGLVVGIDNFTKSLGGFTTVLKTLGTLIGLYFLGRMGMALYDVAKGFLAIGKAAIIAWRSALLMPILIGAAIVGAFLIIEDFIAWLDGRPSTLGFILKNKDKILATLSGWLDSILEYTYKFLKKISVAFMEFFGVPTDQASEAFDSFTATISNAIKFILPWLVKLGNFLTNVLGRAIDGIILLTQGLVTAFVALATNPKQALNDFVLLISDVLKGALLSVMDVVKSLGDSILEFLGIDVSIFAGAWLALEGAISKIIDSIFGFFSDLNSDIEKFISGMIESFTKLFQGDLLGFIASFGTTVLNTIVNVFGSIFSFIAKIIETVFTFATDSIVAIASAIGGKIKAAIIDPIKNALIEVGDFIKAKFGTFAAKLGFDFTNESTPTTINQVQGVLNSPFSGITPAATTSNSSNQSSVNNEIQSTINVTVPPGSDAQGISEAVRKVANEEFNKILRPTARAIKPSVQY